MPQGTNANGPAAFANVLITAQPERITAGGIVLLTAGSRRTKARSRSAGSVEGPVRLAEHDTRIALLGAITVTGGLVTLGTDGNQIRGDPGHHPVDRRLLAGRHPIDQGGPGRRGQRRAPH